MHEAYGTAFEEEWVIWNGSHGLVTTVTIGQIETSNGTRTARLDEPFEMVGPFDFDELETNGRISFAACIVMSRQKWQEDQVELRRESLKIRRAEQQRINEKLGQQNREQHQFQVNQKPFDERKHREALKLPIDGKLERKQINTAYRRLAQKAHPDAGGSDAQFVRITQARDALLEYVSGPAN